MLEIKILFDASPALLTAVGTLAGVVGNTPNRNQATPKGISKTSDVNSETPTVNPEIPTAEEKIPTAAEAAPATRYTLEQVRAAAALKKDKRAEVKAILDELGAPSVPAIPEEKFAVFMEKLAAV